MEKEAVRRGNEKTRVKRDWVTQFLRIEWVASTQSRPKLESSSAFLKLSYETFFCLNPPCLGPGDVYQPSVTMGAPIRAPKQRYIPLQQHHFSQPLS